MNSLNSQYRTHVADRLDDALIGQSVQLSGWVHRVRDHGGVIFIDLRDYTGITQIVCNPDCSEVFQVAERCRCEYVIQISGVLQKRPAGSENAEITSGVVEVVCQTLRILNQSLPLPFAVEQYDDATAGEEIRMQYRFLDLRRQCMAKGLQARALLLKTVRDFLQKYNFMEVETPILTNPSPEGAREYLVPSRVHPGHAFCPTTVTAAVQAVTDDERSGSVLPGCPLFS